MIRHGVVRAGTVLAAPGHAPAIGPGEVTYDDGRITGIRPLPASALTDEEARLLLMPALVNAHDHGRGLRTLAYGAGDSSLETWLPALGRQPKLDPYANAAIAFARMAESGVCAANHCHNTQDGRALLVEAEAVSRAARDTGIRVAFALPFFDRNPVVYGDAAALGEWLPEEEVPATPPLRSLAENRALMAAAAAFEHPLFKLQYCPVGPQWVTDETMVAIARDSAETGRRIHMHLLETSRQRDWADAAYPGGLLNFLDSIAMLGPRLTIAHAVWLRSDELALLAARGVNVSVNPSSNLRLRSGHAPMAAMRAAGLRCGIGMDGMSLDDDEDMLREMRLCWHMNAAADGAAPGLDAAAILEAGLCAGRLGITGDDGGGRLAAGAPADMMTLDFSDIARDCVDRDPDPVPLLVGRATRRHVRQVIVDGRMIVAEGRCTGIDVPALEQAFTAAARGAMRAAPPDQPRIERMQRAIALYYADGRHCAGPGKAMS